MNTNTKDALIENIIAIEKLLDLDGKKLKSDKCSSSSLQRIYYGTPGCGKSYKINKELGSVPKENIFRVTFHPDSDYASFVGSYKPVSKSCESQIFVTGEKTIEEVAEALKEMYVVNGEKVQGIYKFGVSYSKYLNGEIALYNINDVISCAGLPTDYNREIYKAKKLAEWLEKECKSDEIAYKFVPQAFTNAYVAAVKKPEEQIYLVIEEINRGNCAQIFGDLFQLLDRKDGISEFPVKGDADLVKFLNSEGIGGDTLSLPANLHILATMNTSDQSLFPMDSAFKRRWDWEYVPICYDKGEDSGKFTISIGDKEYSWIDFLEKVNEKIFKATDSEDKQMGNYFIKSSVDETTFKSKVMFYLWSEVCKDEFHTPKNFFRVANEDGKEDTEFSFNDLFGTDSAEILKGFMARLGVKPNHSGESTEEA